ncbi:ThiF family adenylyltransferase [Calditerricola satsumensis]|uniref:Thiamine/molybdopterin biosynthesis protein MoeB n=1 Tax=Calditerricola satsumensis TaxID=373054 RepID=A0A8J3F9Y6_9BACI|nr:ThiF family adenylyltransferase [Calditerricola satsumensis]GGJ98807.1 thiamine/molybdopterin biosynthesis protein MoeB [Calditerricola satsumensis]
MDRLWERYSRQILFAPIGREGQERLARSRVAIVGMGALGTVLANHMVRAGVGYVRLIDRDVVEMSNLQRQMLYDEDDARAHLPKAVAAADKLRRINSDVTVEPHVVDLNATNAESLLANVDLVLDGTDNFQVRFLVNDVCVKHGIPWVYGGVVRARGMVALLRPGTTPCLRCLFDSPPAAHTETCDTVGVIGPIVHVVASYQAAEALKLLVGATDKLTPVLRYFDLWEGHVSAMKLDGARKRDCPCCARRRFDFLDPQREAGAVTTLCGRNTVQITPPQPLALNLDDLAARLAAVGPVERNRFLLRARVSDAHTLVVFPDGRVLVQGTDNPVVAKSLYARYIGA